MKKEKTRGGAIVIFVVTFLISIAVFAIAIVKTNAFNHAKHDKVLSGDELFLDGNTDGQDVYVKAIPRESTWTKKFDIENKGLTEPDFKAYTYDFTVSNNTKDEVLDFKFKLDFKTKAFISSAWNGALEFHQITDGKELVETIPDLRNYNPSDYKLRTLTVDGETMIEMNEGDYIVYYPSNSVNAMEVPIEPKEAMTPGIILYTPIEKSIDESVLKIDFTFHRPYTAEPLFWISIVAAGLWLIALVVFIIISAQLRKYKLQHERDNKIINESIETFTGFIDAKDPYTNGHSKRVALYTRCIAEEMGCTGEELERMYYIALLHDCGKIGVPDNILGKPGKLTDEEFGIIKSHANRGGDILKSFKSIDKAYEGALYHHERYDGNGYPTGLVGEDIPLIARIICVADSFDAMNSNRVYRKKLTKEAIIAEIENNKGTQFDPKIADVFLKLYKENRMPEGDASSATASE